ncbi:MAG: TerB family tellurite resistance protein [Bacteroidetes bacterium]|nr:TerB family tellurite resistance protein [Bacteroidota bacterium]MBU1718084.1 TerB family tellurite resistance protein [Bacteroidota bacterium]
MAKYAKWLGGGLGWAFGGPVGAIIGFAVGSFYDSAGKSRSTTGGDFTVSLLILAAAVMKADGKVLKSELDTVRNFFAAQFGPKVAQERMLVLREILKQEFNIQEVCTQIKSNMQHQTRLLLVKFMFDIANADGQIHPTEKDLIRRISQYLGISQADYDSLISMYVKDTTSAYKILEISPDVADDDVKKAYRRLASKHHPDKVMHLGEEYQKAAKEKFQNIQEAYDLIKKERGMV